MAIEVGKSKKSLDIVLLFRSRPILNTGNFSRIYTNSALRDYHSEIFSLELLKFTLLIFKEELILLKNLKYFMHYASVFLQKLCEYQNVIQIYHYYVSIDEISEEIIYHYLKSSQRIG